MWSFNSGERVALHVGIEKLAMTETLLLMITLQILPMTVGQPVQPSKTDPDAGVASKIIKDPGAKDSLQDGGQVVDDVLLVIYPFPLTIKGNEYCRGGGV